MRLPYSLYDPRLGHDGMADCQGALGDVGQAIPIGATPADPWIWHAACAHASDEDQQDGNVRRIADYERRLQRQVRGPEPRVSRLCHLMAAMLVPVGITPDGFAAVARSDAARLRASGLAVSTEAAAIAACARLQLGCAPALPEHHLRLAYLLSALPRLVYFPSSSRLLPLATLLAAKPGDPLAIAQRVAGIYDAAVVAGLPPGADLSRGAAILLLGSGEPKAATARAAALAAAYGERGCDIACRCMEALTLLACLEREAGPLAQDHVAWMSRLGEGMGQTVHEGLVFTFAASLLIAAATPSLRATRAALDDAAPSRVASTPSDQTHAAVLRALMVIVQFDQQFPRIRDAA